MYILYSLKYMILYKRELFILPAKTGCILGCDFIDMPARLFHPEFSTSYNSCKKSSRLLRVGVRH